MRNTIVSLGEHTGTSRTSVSFSKRDIGRCSVYFQVSNPILAAQATERWEEPSIKPKKSPRVDCTAEVVELTELPYDDARLGAVGGVSRRS